MQEHKDAIPDLISLQTWLKRKAKRFSLLASLRADAAECEIDNRRAVVRLREAILAVSLDGLDHAAKPMLGEPLAEKKVLGARTVEHTIFADSQIKVGVDSESVTAQAKLSGTAGLKTSAKTKKETKEVHLPVRALPGGRWRISEPDNEPLASTFLQANVLCELDPAKGANRQAVVSTVHAKQRDLIIDVEGSDLFSRTKMRVAEIVLKKSLQDPQYGPFKGLISLCNSEVEAESDEE